MDPSAIFRRSTAGQLALDSRDARLNARMRALLLMAEGKPLSQFATMAEGLGAPADAFEQLAALGFIDTSPGQIAGAQESGRSGEAGSAAPMPPFERFRAASGLIREVAKDVLGLKSFFFMLKVEKCATLADLEMLVPEFIQALEKRQGRAAAARFEAQLRRMLG
jgi:hypothetical protein